MPPSLAPRPIAGPPRPVASGVDGPIGVIVTAFRRRQFVAEAVDSVRQQTFPHDRIELCIVSDFPSEEVAPAGGFGRVVRIRPEGSAQGPWIAAALDAVHADLLCFLDDDDRFAPTKLEAVSSRFDADPQLGFLRNGLSFFGSARAARTGQERRFAGREGAYLARSDRTGEAIARLWATGAAFNQSSMAVRREVLSRHRSTLERIRGGCPAFLFFASVASPIALRMEADPLTLYRCHEANESPSAARSRSEWWSRSLRLAGTRAHDAAEILRMLEAEGGGAGVALIRRALAQNHVLSQLASGRPARRALLRAVAGLLRSSGPRAWWADRALLGTSLIASSVAPSFARSLAGTAAPGLAP